MTRQVTDQLYIELDYFTPEEYYTYYTEAQAALASEATLTANAGIVKVFSAALTSSATMSVTGSKLINFTVGQLLNSVAFTSSLTGTMAISGNFSMADRAENYLISFWVS